MRLCEWLAKPLVQLLHDVLYLLLLVLRVLLMFCAPLLKQICRVKMYVSGVEAEYVIKQLYEQFATCQILFLSLYLQDPNFNVAV